MEDIKMKMQGFYDDLESLKKQTKEIEDIVNSFGELSKKFENGFINNVREQISSIKTNIDSSNSKVINELQLNKHETYKSIVEVKQEITNLNHKLVNISKLIARLQEDNKLISMKTTIIIGVQVVTLVLVGVSLFV